jgi:phosphoglucosamine mutase
MSNVGLSGGGALGVRVVRTKVGDRYVVEEMRRSGHSLGGEQSGHLIFLEHATTGDGTLAALQLLAVMCRQQKPLSELASIFEPVPQTLLSLAVKERRELEGIPEVTRAIAAAEEKLGKEGRVFVRFSGTESKVRILIEGPDSSRNEEHAQSIAAALRSALG